jgi:hypothetical protein
MTKTTPVLLAGAAALLAAAIPALAAETMGDGGRKVWTTLSGAAEVPGPGDTDGYGAFAARVNPGKNEVCYTLTVGRIDTATAAHIHRGASDVAGPVAVALEAPADGSSEGCVTVSNALAMALVKDPQDYYVNVHNAAFPAGAVRGQLATK